MLAAGGSGDNARRRELLPDVVGLCLMCCTWFGGVVISKFSSSRLSSISSTKVGVRGERLEYSSLSFPSSLTDWMLEFRVSSQTRGVSGVMVISVISDISRECRGRFGREILSCG